MTQAMSSPIGSTNPMRVVTDTSELRWFARGRLPVDLLAWFGQDGELGVGEERCDSYRFDGRDDVGVKHRGHGVLELKVRRSVDDSAPDLGLAGGRRLELWRRWSPADGLVEPEPADRWVHVAKTIVRRRFLDDGLEVPALPVAPAGGFCDVELVALEVEGSPWWSLGLSVYGFCDAQPDLMRLAWNAVADGRPHPKPLDSALGVPQGYPAWLGGAATTPGGWLRTDTASRQAESLRTDRGRVRAGNSVADAGAALR